MGSISLKAKKVGAKNTKNVLDGVKVKTNKVQVTSTDYTEPETVDSANVTVGVFFDGTGNNRFNTEARELYEKGNNGTKLTEDEQRKAKKNLTDISYIPGYQLYEYFKNDGFKKPQSGSYENDFSNVARLFELYKTEDTEKEKFKSVYVEGIGTANGMDDDIPGSATGMGMLWYQTGIRDKVKIGCDDVGKKIKDFQKKEINKLTIDVFGFSRGAAAARNFVHEIHKKKSDVKYHRRSGNRGNPDAGKVYYKEDGGLLGEYLAENGIKVKFAQVRFIGLFDSVASHGLVQHNDAVDLGLDAVKHAQHTFHLCAADEHRSKFSLTDIRSASSRGIQKFLPGVHSDIGGCYRDGGNEKNIGLNFAHLSIDAQDQLRRDKQYLIEQGWYTEKQLSIREELLDWSTLLGIRDDSFKMLIGNRENLSNQYSYIPLQFMHEQANNKELGFATASEFEVCDAILTEIEKRLYSYVFEDAPAMDFYNNEEDRNLLFKVRNKYFHFSSDYLAIGMHPQWKDNKRVREIYSDNNTGSRIVPLQYGHIPLSDEQTAHLHEILNKNNEVEDDYRNDERINMLSKKDEIQSPNYLRKPLKPE